MYVIYNTKESKEIIYIMYVIYNTKESKEIIYIMYVIYNTKKLLLCMCDITHNC